VEVFVAPCFGGCSGTYLMTPPGISIFEIYLINRIRIRHADRNTSTLTDRKKVQIK
jgi:hypothetical protein